MATVIPFRRDNGLKAAHHDVKHGSILDRLSIPSKVAMAIDLAAMGKNIDEINNVDCIQQWVEDYRAAVLEL